MNTSNIHYDDKNNNIARERLDPGLSHSRYVHLKLLKKHVERLVNENLISGKKIKLADGLNICYDWFLKNKELLRMF